MRQRAATPADKANARQLILNALTANARAQRDTERLIVNLIVRADKLGIKQTAVAKAAGVSQAHVSRVLAADRKEIEARKATRAAKKRGENGRV
jgi:DNA-directed RNA polymerase specialized sigma subunit